MDVIMIHKEYKRNSIILLALLILITSLPYTPLTSIVKYTVIQSQIKPIMWTILSIVMILFVPRIHSIGKVKDKDTILVDAIICVTLLLGIRLLAALLIDEFGRSPYDLSLYGILLNLLRIGPELAAKELIRGYSLGTYCRKGINLIFWLVTIIISLSNISLGSILQVKNVKDSLIFFAETLGPEISIGFLLSYLALFGGTRASLAYNGILGGFLRFFPVLPVLQWITAGVINITVPILEAFFISGKYEKKQSQGKAAKESLLSIVGWTVTYSFSVLMIWFIVGVFPYYPHVIATGSMRPLIYEGDVIVIKKAMKEEDILELKSGDIIQFTRDDILITHRILRVFKDEDGNLTFQTKGDNNASEDARLVLPKEVRGTLAKVIPKLGLPTLWIKTVGQGQPSGVEN